MQKTNNFLFNKWRLTNRPIEGKVESGSDGTRTVFFQKISLHSGL